MTRLPLDLSFGSAPRPQAEWAAFFYYDPIPLIEARYALPESPITSNRNTHAGKRRWNFRLHPHARKRIRKKTAAPAGRGLGSVGSGWRAYRSRWGEI